MNLAILSTILLLGAAPAAGPHDHDAVFADSDKGAWELAMLHKKALAKAGTPDDGVARDKISVLGLSHVKGEPAYKIKVQTGDDSYEYRWLDMKTYLELKRAPAEAPAPAPEKSAASDSNSRGAGG